MVVVAARMASLPPVPQLRFHEAADGMTLALECFGAGDAPTILFAHGFGQTRHAWTATASTLAASGYRCICVDGRGHGESGWLEHEDYTIDQYIADARELVAQCATPPILVGASMGGLIGLLAEAESDVPLFRAL